jgi:uncharacterized protein (TIGR04222 family)
MKKDPARLIAELEAFALDDPGAAEPFSARLARENGWSVGEALRVVREYKRFLALAATVEHVVTPSEQVDQAWHLHLLYSARYRELCHDVLGFTLDHGPSRGGNAQLQHFSSAYEQTLASYRQLFGEAPPEDIWPPSAVRFGPGRLARRVSEAEYWVVRKPGWWPWLERRVLPSLSKTRLLLGALVLLGGPLSVSTAISGHDFLIGYVGLWGLTLFAAFVVRVASEPGSSSDDPRLEPYELLQLAQGPLGAVDGALTSLIAGRALGFDEAKGELRVMRPLAEHAPELERRVVSEVEGSGDPSVVTLRRKAAELTRDVARRLEGLGLMTTGRERAPYLLAWSVPVLGLLRIVSRIGTDKPVGNLVLLVGCGAVVALLLRPKAKRTRRGEELLERTRAGYRETSADELSQAGQLPLSFALFGVAAVTLPDAAPWTGWLSRASARADSSGGCGSGCGGDGGGGCGGGCGGCGGCGGE